MTEVPAPKGEPGQGDITRCDTRLRVAVTTVSPHQSPLSDRCMCVCERVCRVPARAEDGDEGQNGWMEGRMRGKKYHLKLITYPFCCCSFLCSESTGHDDGLRRLGLANVSVTWGKTVTHVH